MLHFSGNVIALNRNDKVRLDGKGQDIAIVLINVATLLIFLITFILPLF